MEGITFDDEGLVPVIAQDRASGQIRMLAWADRDAIAKTMATGEAHFWSRSRRAAWKKGETSGHVLRVHELWTDCDADAVVYLVDPVGPTCHTGRRSCFFRVIGEKAAVVDAGDGLDAAPVLDRLFATLVARKQSASAERSYTRALLDGGAAKIGAKVREEADELARALADEPDARVVAEAADLVFHALVGLVHRGLSAEDVARELARRMGTSGHAEKASRTDG
ncbi:MAG: bifunctional phosphoribosyl-AMP cyclohydrolase/phosphoribosyl-ATP diphosphatase HisIE [Deltaproteobacteria bacterium]|nr:bifunctional phosphoribosyl-AMP cyclohydrolase/phosphoribosyl-ATP diphosphatase HisIE [Deltaproteobacteria bacterium]